MHGDYRLGQVMRTQTGWVVRNFEGESASPPTQRRARSSVLGDVADMLRSFYYAARHQLLAHPDADRLAAQATDWVQRNGEAFCAGYAAADGIDLADNWVLLRAMLLDKAVCEVICVNDLPRLQPPVELHLRRFETIRPIECMGGGVFSLIGELTYLLTLPSHGFGLAPVPTGHPAR